MAAKWEEHAQQQAMQMETDGGAAEEEGAAADETTTGGAETVQAPANGVDRTNEAGQSIEAKTDAVGVSGVGADEGSAVDANADVALPDMASDAKASQRVAGVTPASTSDGDPTSTADAAEARRHKKQKAVAKD